MPLHFNHILTESVPALAADTASLYNSMP